MGRRPLPPWPPPQKQPVSDDDDRLALRQPHHGGPRGACGGNSGLRGPGTPAFSPGAARTGSARRRDQIRRAGAAPELCGQAKFTPLLGCRWAGTAECGGHLRTPAAARRLAASRGESSPAKAGGARPGPRSPRPPLRSPASRSRPLSARRSLAPRRAPLTPGRVFCSCRALWAFSADSRSQ